MHRTPESSNFSPVLKKSILTHNTALVLCLQYSFCLHVNTQACSSCKTLCTAICQLMTRIGVFSEMSAILVGLYRQETVRRTGLYPDNVLHFYFNQTLSARTRFKHMLLFIFKGSFDGGAGVDLLKQTSCLGPLYQSDAAR